MHLEFRDLTDENQFADYCDCCDRIEDDCGMKLFNLYLGFGEPFILCFDCLIKMDKLISHATTYELDNANLA